MAGQPGGKLRLFQKAFEQVDDGLRHGIFGHPQDDEALEFVRWVIADVGKVHVAGDKGRAGAAGAGGNFGVGRMPQADVARVFAGVAKAGQQRKGRARHVGVHEKAHGLRGEQMKGLLFGQIADVFEGGADVFHGQVVFLPQLLKGHAAGEAADHERDGHSRATDDGLAVADGRVNDNAVFCVHNPPITFHTLDSKANCCLHSSHPDASCFQVCGV